MSQKPGMRQVLVFENREPQGMRVAAELKNFSSSFSFDVITVSTLVGLKQVLKTHVFAAVIIEVGREAGDALAALRLLGKGDPLIPLYIYNGFSLSRIAEKALEYDYVRYYDEQTDLVRFLALVLDELSRKRRGILHGMALGSFLHLMSSEEFNGRLIVTAGEKKGILFLRDGRFLGASINGARSHTALAEMSGWQKVTVEIREEGSERWPGADQGESAVGPTEKARLAAPAGASAAVGHIDMLRFDFLGRRVSLDIKRLNAAMEEIQGQLADYLVRMDIFLSTNGRSLAGWNSHPLACSAFAAVTRSVVDSLRESSLPRLRHYYLLDLADEHTVLIVIDGELLWGLLLRGAKSQMGLLLNFALPVALKALAEALQYED